jgi:1-acyl-sn-glycerol-3-phosphate acyltransferase
MPLWRDPCIPQLGPNVPRSHGRLAAAFGRLMLGLSGWRISGTFPDVPKAVLIVAPHTSNWDFPIGVYVKLALRLGGRFVGKHTLFRGPFGLILRWLGGIPVDRSAATGFVGAAAAELRLAEKMVLVLAPEGTRRRAPWKSGFWRIAREAGVPVLPCAFDYRSREVVFLPLFETTVDYERDLAALRSLYSPEMALVPRNYE